MMKEFILELNDSSPALFLVLVIATMVMVISLGVYVLLTLIIKILMYKQKNEIYTKFIESTPQLFKPWINMKIGGWLSNMTIPYYPYWTFRLFDKLDREQVDEWRNVVKKYFGNKYFLFKTRVFFNNITLYILIPYLCMIISLLIIK
ncbi:TPA: hypothetical protein ACX6QF_003946 [Photobacterium damselae]